MSLPRDWFDQLKREYPRRSGGQGWMAVKRLVPQHVNQGVSFEEVLDGTRAYAKWCRYTGKVGTELVKQARTFFGRDAWFLEDYPLPEDGSPTMTIDDEAEKHGLKRQDGEADEQLRRRIGIAQTKAIYSR